MAAKFPPRGTRGMGFSRIHRYGGPDDAWVAAQNSGTICYVMIETQGAFDECEAIARMECVDGLFIGPSDLSLNRGRGVFGFAHPNEGREAKLIAEGHEPIEGRFVDRSVLHVKDHGIVACKPRDLAGLMGVRFEPKSQKRLRQNHSPQRQQDSHGLSSIETRNAFSKNK
jgi:hypothetical protein